MNLISYFRNQLEHAGVVATDHELLCEFYRDTANEPHVVLHSPFGGRVNGAWAIALAAALEKRYGAEVQYTYDDDGILIRLPDTTEPPPMQEILQLSGGEIEKLPEDEKRIYGFLCENGASFGRDIFDGTGLATIQVQQALGTLANASLVSCDDYFVFLQVMQPSASKPVQNTNASSWEKELPGWQQRVRLRKPIRRAVCQPGGFRAVAGNPTRPISRIRNANHGEYCRSGIAFGAKYRVGYAE